MHCFPLYVPFLYFSVIPSRPHVWPCCGESSQHVSLQNALWAVIIRPVVAHTYMRTPPFVYVASPGWMCVCVTPLGLSVSAPFCSTTWRQLVWSTPHSHLFVWVSAYNASSLHSVMILLSSLTLACHSSQYWTDFLVWVEKKQTWIWSCWSVEPLKTNVNFCWGFVVFLCLSDAVLSFKQSEAYCFWVCSSILHQSCLHGHNVSNIHWLKFFRFKDKLSWMWWSKIKGQGHC